MATPSDSQEQRKIKYKFRNTHTHTHTALIRSIYCTSQIHELNHPVSPWISLQLIMSQDTSKLLLIESKQSACWAVCPQCIRTFIICLVLSFFFKQTPLHSADVRLSLHSGEILENYFCVTADLLFKLSFKIQIVVTSKEKVLVFCG